MEHYQYRYSGLRVESDQPIPEWSMFRCAPSAATDVSICFSEPLEQPPASTDQIASVCADEYRFYVPDVGLYRVREGWEIVVTPLSGAGKRELRLFLLGSAWGALCYQRGLLVLHASAVLIDDAAFAFCAPAGGGKSSLAAWLSEQGYPLVSDDLCRFEISATGPVYIYPSSARLKLWTDTLNALGWDKKGLERDHLRMEKFHVGLGESCVTQPQRLGGIYLLEWGSQQLTPLSGQEALQRFLSVSTYRSELLKAMGQVVPYSRRCLKLLQRVPVFELQRPRDFAAIDKSLELITRGC